MIVLMLDTGKNCRLQAHYTVVGNTYLYNYMYFLHSTGRLAMLNYATRKPASNAMRDSVFQIIEGSQVKNPRSLAS